MAGKTPIVRDKWLGLNTKAEEEGLPISFAAELQNYRAESGRLKPRRGSDRVVRASDNMAALDLDGSADYVLVSSPTAAWTLKRHWTYRQVIEPDTVSGTQYLIGWSHATDWPFQLYLDDSTLTWVVKDTGDTTATLTATGLTATKIGIQCQRVGTALTLYVDGASADTDTMSDLDCKVPAGHLHIGHDQSGGFFNGSMDGPELFDGSHPFRQPLVRHADPITCRAWYDFKSRGNSIVRDLSRYRNHGKTQSSPPEVSALSHAWRPIRGLRSYVNRGGRRRLFFVAKDVPYVAEVS